MCAKVVNNALLQPLVDENQVKLKEKKKSSAAQGEREGGRQGAQFNPFSEKLTDAEREEKVFTDRSDESLLTSRTTPTRGGVDASSCYGKLQDVYRSIKGRCEFASLIFLLGLPCSIAAPIMKSIYGVRESEEGVRLETQTQIFLHLLQLSKTIKLKGFGMTNILEMNLQKGRKIFEKTLSQPQNKHVRVENVLMASDGNASSTHHHVPARIYTPKALVSTDVPLPVLVFYHGGGWVIGNRNTVNGFLSWISHWSKCVVVSVEYRLAPENPFPAAVEDALNSFQWVARHAAQRGWDPRKIAVGGDSAGGNLAAVVSQLAVVRQFEVRPSLQVLLFPALYLGNKETAFKSVDEFGSDSFYGLHWKDMLFFRNAYIGAQHDGLDHRTSPVLAEDYLLRELPPAYFGLCHFDVLRDEGREYANRLRENGVSVHVDEFDAHHGFIYVFHRVKYAKRCLKDIAIFLRNQMYPSKL